MYVARAMQWVALGGAMGSNLAASARAILSKRKMGMDMGKNVTPANMYGVLTIMASMMLLPLSALIEGPKIQGLWESTVEDDEMGWVCFFFRKFLDLSFIFYFAWFEFVFSIIINLFGCFLFQHLFVFLPLIVCLVLWFFVFLYIFCLIEGGSYFFFFPGISFPYLSIFADEYM